MKTPTELLISKPLKSLHLFENTCQLHRDDKFVTLLISQEDQVLTTMLYEKSLVFERDWEDSFRLREPLLSSASVDWQVSVQGLRPGATGG